MNDYTIYGYIYLITNLTNNKQYVGLTTRSVDQRFKEHCKANSFIGNAIRKYGVESFTIDIIDECMNETELLQSECEMIYRYDTYENGYNQTLGGDGVRLTSYLEVELSEKQHKFCRYVEKRNSQPLDGTDKTELMKSTLLTTVYLYLVSRIKKDKIRAAKMLTRLKPEYVKAIGTLNVLDGQEVIDYASQK